MATLYAGSDNYLVQRGGHALSPRRAWEASQTTPFEDSGRATLGPAVFLARPERLLAVCCFLIVACSGPSARADEENPTVGMPARIKVVLPGPELEARPIENRDAPLVLRLVHVEEVEDGFRYDLEYTGLVP